jgi:hypothetical protein
MDERRVDEQRVDEQREASVGEVPAPQLHVRVQAPTDMAGAPTFYANMVQVATGPYDFTLHFSWFSTPVLEEPPPPGEDVTVIARPVASVTIPTHIMGSLIQVLQGQFANWQSFVGQSMRDETPAAQQEEAERQ